MLSRHLQSVRAALAGVVGLALATFAVPASADFIGNTTSGGTPTAFTPQIVSAGDFSGPGGSNVIIGPNTLIFKPLNTYNAGFDLNILFNISGATFDNSSGNAAASVASENPDGTIGAFTDLGFPGLSQLASIVFVRVTVTDPVSYIKLSNLNFINAAALATPGNSISLSVTIRNLNNPDQVFEVQGFTPIITSAEVPAPGALALLGFGLVSLVGMAPRRRKHARI
jgi:hypothetical protein